MLILYIDDWDSLSRLNMSHLAPVSGSLFHSPFSLYNMVSYSLRLLGYQFFFYIYASIAE